MNKYILSALSFIFFQNMASAGTINYTITELEGNIASMRLDVHGVAPTPALTKQLGTHTLHVPDAVYDGLTLHTLANQRFMETVCSDEHGNAMKNIDLRAGKNINLIISVVDGGAAQHCHEAGG